MQASRSPTPRRARGRRCARRAARAKLPPADELLWLLDQGETIAAIAARFGAAEKSVEKVLERARQAAVAEDEREVHDWALADWEAVDDPAEVMARALEGVAS